MSSDRMYDDEGNRRDADRDDDRRRGRRDDDDDDDRPRRRRRSSGGGGGGSGKILLILFGGGFLFVLLCCGGCFGLGMYGNKTAKEANPVETDNLFAEGLQKGDSDAVWKNAHDDFKLKYKEPEYRNFVSAHSNLFARDSLYGGFYKTKTGSDNNSYTMIVSKPGGIGDPGVRLYFLKNAVGKLAFVGASPGLDAAIPFNLHFDPNSVDPEQ